MERRVRHLIAALLCIALCAGVAWAHPTLPTVALVKVTEDGRVRITLVHDALAYALNDTSARVSDSDMRALLSGPESELADAFKDARERLEGGFQLSADGAAVAFEIVDEPRVDAVRLWKEQNPGQPLPLKMEFGISAVLPRGAAAMTLRFPAVLSEVLLSVDRPGVEPQALPLSAGERSPAIDVRGASGAARSTSDGGERAPARPASFAEVALRYARLGYLHIIPRGADHALFVLGLFLLTPRVGSVLWQISAFTLAHTMTLTLATLHVVTLPARIIEPAIAVSIAFIAVENLVVRRVHPWRTLVAFVFGLVHGMGFASGLMEIGLPTGQLAAGLVAFNVGVEGGHLTVLAGAFLLLGWWRGRAWYRSRVSIPVSIVIALVALVWFVQRV